MILNPMFGCYYGSVSPTGVSKRGRSLPLPPPPESKKASPPPRNSSLTITEESKQTKIRYGNFDEILLVQLAIYQVVNLPKGFASYIEFKTRTDAKKAQLYMDGAQIDRKVVHARFTLPEQKKATSPTRVVATS
ncbi:Serine/arginine-rich splicing factor SR45 [Capsicum chinense]|nr:Serine/arginine-rich splicing factor SR45 [Capsicum chinense]